MHYPIKGIITCMERAIGIFSKKRRFHGTCDKYPIHPIVKNIFGLFAGQFFVDHPVAVIVTVAITQFINKVIVIWVQRISRDYLIRQFRWQDKGEIAEIVIDVISVIGFAYSSLQIPMTF